MSEFGERRRLYAEIEKLRVEMSDEWDKLVEHLLEGIIPKSETDEMLRRCLDGEDA